jgi:periplasmic divalent cation tolerance protein
MIFVYTSVNKQDSAKKLAHDAIDNKLAACVDFWPMHSVYEWKGEKVDVDQYMMMFTTHSHLAPKLEDLMSQEHPYSVPMVARVQLDVVNEVYKHWVGDQIGR